MVKNYEDKELKKEEVLLCQIYILREVLWKAIERANMNLLDETVLKVSKRMDEVLNDYCAEVAKRKAAEEKEKNCAEKDDKK